jgi:hypothetical protein
VAPRRRLGRSLLLAALAILGTTSAVVADSPSEYQVKAVFLYNFAKFVEWPEQDVADGRLLLCIFGADPFGQDIDTSIDGKTVRGKRLTVTRMGVGDELRRCQILFVPAAELIQWPLIFEELRGAPVLTVGEGDGFAARGGMINFLIEDRKVRFEINPTASQVAGVRISSQLLKLATRLLNETAE